MSVGITNHRKFLSYLSFAMLFDGIPSFNPDFNNNTCFRKESAKFNNQ